MSNDDYLLLLSRVIPLKTSQLYAIIRCLGTPQTGMLQFLSPAYTAQPCTFREGRLSLTVCRDTLSPMRARQYSPKCWFIVVETQYAHLFTWSDCRVAPCQGGKSQEQEQYNTPPCIITVLLSKNRSKRCVIVDETGERGLLIPCVLLLDPTCVPRALATPSANGGIRQKFTMGSIYLFVHAASTGEKK